MTQQLQPVADIDTLRDTPHQRIELGDGILAHREQDPERGNAIQRLGDLNKHAFAFRPAVLISREQLLELIEYQDGPLAARRRADRAENIEECGFGSAGCRAIRCFGGQRIADAGNIDIGRGRQIFRRRTANANDRRRRKPGSLQTWNDRRVDERALAGTRLRIKQHGAMEHEQRQNIVGLAVAAEKHAAVSGLKRSRPDIGLACSRGHDQTWPCTSAM